MVQTELRNATLDDLARLLQEQHANKLDVVAPAAAVRSQAGQIVLAGTAAEITEHGVTTTEGAYQPTDIFDAGLAEKLGIPVSYVRRLRAERIDLYDANVNGWLHGEQPPADGDRGDGSPSAAADPRSFLMRCFRGDDGGPGIARALLSDRYGIVDNLDVLMAALEGVQRAGVNVDIAGCDLTEQRMRVRVVAPQVQALAPELLAGYRSPFTGQEGTANPVVFAGFEIGNSETGGGAFKLTPRLEFQVCSNGMTITRDALRGVHVGARLEKGVVRWSAETERKTLELVTSRARDAVATFLDLDYVRAQLAEITEQAVKPVEDAARTIALVAAKLSYTKDQQASILNHFIRGGQLTAGGIMHAVTSVAQTIKNPDVAADMEGSALRALALAAGTRELAAVA